MIRRLALVLVMLAVCCDMTVQVLIRAVVYVPFGISQPNARETINAWMGTAAAKGYRWGLIGAALIDDVFGNGHCAAQAGFERGWDTAA